MPAMVDARAADGMGAARGDGPLGALVGARELGTETKPVGDARRVLLGLVVSSDTVEARAALLCRLCGRTLDRGDR